MPIRINTAARNAGLAAILALIDGGSGAGVLRIYSGSQPATPATSPSGTKLAEITLSDPAFGSPNTGSADIDITPALDVDGLATAAAGWCRFCDSTEAAATGLGVIDGEVTLTGGGGLITLNTLAISTGVGFLITGGSISQPASA
ncbi:hypothetical protein [Herbidospora mongoliensis]|uniref:hypothetical protein n=1 Tax=Herbidospora mongoliensis TaxID=688067 RepID=UPI00083471E7|nr:hypothetical protein [Herbidospora mongoliensis]